ncbi:RagB/SusD family nutrient uptake outer membrane protein [Sphingobacterium sp. xlx-130]|uniref:RagB/SusD family nutrient uptake outer membrane protein n=1 Tax=Sphingobacterium sp. xlx-130 TaxID=2654323 RepID=UPI0013D96491|nr:RagB/SusD family nutrient uptake outer membrane protein [Sphingobacterium sp. xlx-130]
MKKYYIYLLFAFVVLSTTACKEYLDITPKGYVIPSKIEDFERILNDANIFRFLSTDIDFLSDDYYATNIDPTNFKDNVQSRLYFWKKDIYATEEEISYSFWSSLFGSIYQFNAIINNVEKSVGATPDRAAKIKAQAQFGRALAYWYLVNIYTKPYASATAGTDLGIPLVVNNDITKQLPGRGTVQATYDFIVKDLTESLGAVPESAANPYMISKPAVYGFLARTYLMMGKYDLAAKAAGDALSFNNQLIDYNEVCSEKVSRNGVPYIGVKPGVTVFSDHLKVPENIFSLLFTYIGGMYYQPIAKETEKLFDADDLRRVFFNPYMEIGAPWNGLYTYMEQFAYVNPGITTAEMYLIRAESRARTKDLAGAMQDINTLRKNRIKADEFTDMTATSETDAVKFILLERRKELLFKGARWFDMRRLNNDPQYGFTAYHYFIDGTKVAIEPNSPSYTLNLPESALATHIVQN